MIAEIKENLISKILMSNDEVLLKQLSLILDSNVNISLNQIEKEALDVAYKAIENKEVITDEEMQKEWDEWVK